MVSVRNFPVLATVKSYLNTLISLVFNLLFRILYNGKNSGALFMYALK